MDDNQSLLQFDPVETMFASHRPPGSPSSIGLERGFDLSTQVHEAFTALSPNHNTLLQDDVNVDSSISSSGDSTNITSHQYPTALFRTLDSQQSYSTDTRIALTQVLTSFQGAVMDQALEDSTFPLPDENNLQTTETRDGTSDILAGVPTVGAMRSRILPELESLSSRPSTLLEGFAVAQDDSRALSVNDFVTIPRGSLPRRRYATRDYSSGSISSDDWLHHPDVEAFRNAQDAPPTEPSTGQQRDINHEPDISIGFEPVSVFPESLAPSLTQSAETPHTPEGGQTRTSQTVITHAQDEELVRSLSDAHGLQQEGLEVQRMIARLSVASAPASSHATEQITDSLAQGDDDSSLDDRIHRPPQVAVPDMEEPSNTATESTISDEIVDTSRSDRLDLLGPLLSGTRTASSTSSTETLDFSLLGSSRPGFDSSILSMTSRIRQARLTRLLRLMGEREASVGYPERYPWGRFSQADTRSMINHTGASRGTSRAGSLEDGLVDLGPETDAADLTFEESRGFIRNRDQVQAPGPLPVPPLASAPSQFHPIHYPTFTEILDSNGNSIEWSGSESYASSSASSIASHDTIEEREEDLDWMNTVDQQRQQRQRQREQQHLQRQLQMRRRARLERLRWDHGIICGHGRTRVVSSGTVFEGLEYISEADSLLAENHRYQSLKASWVTNPNGESWSDDDENSPQRRRQGGLAGVGGVGGSGDTDDKDQETVFHRRGHPSLGVLQPSLQYPYLQPQHPQFPLYGSSGGGSSTGLYHIYGNVRNRYGPEGTRRRRVMSEMSDLLRLEQDWERELEQYNREMAV
ncbi:hypothetical protein BGZ98_001261, partial [Dissophora globulifera]